jgi:putative transposase
MPNHIHGIVVIDKQDGNCLNSNNNGQNGSNADGNADPNGNANGNGIADTRLLENSRLLVETRLIASLQPLASQSFQSNEQRGGMTGFKNPILQDNLSRITRWYKGRTTFESRKTNADFAWLSRFHDHFIRNGESFQQISEYIHNNPANWADDEWV